jgi:hypothetical protein
MFGADILDACVDRRKNKARSVWASCAQAKLFIVHTFPKQSTLGHKSDTTFLRLWCTLWGLGIFLVLFCLFLWSHCRDVTTTTLGHTDRTCYGSQEQVSTL